MGDHDGDGAGPVDPPWRDGRDGGPDGGRGEGNVEPGTVTCRRCGREWDLAYEVDELGLGEQARHQFALDHARHTGHYPDGVATWRAACRHCPEGVERLSERAVVRWAETHSRHTRHAVAVRTPTDEAGEERVVDRS